MDTDASSGEQAVAALRLTALETELLELFAPTSPSTPIRAFILHDENGRLLRMDAIHRANNLAHMSVSLAKYGDRPKMRGSPTAVSAHARQLARKYEELGLEHASQKPVPCAELLTGIVTQLTAIFGQSRQIAITVDADPVSLPPEVRRTLILIGSELVINALKYAYPAREGGTIAVRLIGRPDEVELVIEDDGVGVAETYCAGNGGGLLEKLVQMVGATMTRTTREAGHGYRVSTVLPTPGRD